MIKIFTTRKIEWFYRLCRIYRQPTAEEELNISEIRLYWIKEAEEALTVAEHLFENLPDYFRFEKTEFRHLPSPPI